jgi:hypothetical protein
MTLQILTGEDYSVQHDPEAQAVSFSGSIRLQTMDDYAPIRKLLDNAIDTAGSGATVVLDFRNLRFLNSSGINAISRFVIDARKQDNVMLRVLGKQEIYWQQKSLTNFQRLWSKVTIDIQ